ncbi:predicted protein [Aspergillus nidulans FGSC A4]|uniref:Uncharacterized protein n=1 Tax=Emericella nidulans (strain FGSC A4 / ATCC 38163 / CBS 112.46 / NRRL 194 / M139) TaxID=227321 RepID=Q5B253_EMENI|nr:hypothetical protein [Aspergillus nidulans FGSC A4]EAA62537.1 predicted protein [Aspergillus nidulans FGSC A4]CBF82009.1 TPA: conserved hypothetical protein [Aspergillus nidulans FGSC A4]|eukprot:XP_662981.1 predicted protein [Aspergillus nidulans FGSC A4]
MSQTANLPISTDPMSCGLDLAALVDWPDDKAVEGLTRSAFYANDAEFDIGEQLKGSMNSPVAIDNVDARPSQLPTTLARAPPNGPNPPNKKASRQIQTSAWVPYDIYIPPQNVQVSGNIATKGSLCASTAPAPNIMRGSGSSSPVPYLASQLNRARAQPNACKEVIKELQRVLKASSDGEVIRRLLNTVARKDREAEASRRELSDLEDECEMYKVQLSRVYEQSQASRKAIAQYEREFGRMEYQIKVLRTQLKLAKSERDRLRGQMNKQQ